MFDQGGFMYMMSAADVAQYLLKKPLLTMMSALHDRLCFDFSRWDAFQKQPRMSLQVPNGVLECMPIADDQYYAMKYVNGHPGNPKKGLPSIVSLGLLACVDNGCPLILCDMTLLTAWRTACMTALVARYTVRPDIDSVGIIGLGAQAPFQIAALLPYFKIKTVYAYDLDQSAADRFKQHVLAMGIQEVQMMPPEQIAKATDFLITVTAKKGQDPILYHDWLREGMHISAVGGDAPGKTELEAAIVQRATLIADYWPQTEVEGESQQRSKRRRDDLSVYDLIAHTDHNNTLYDQLTVFDSVGFALEDFSALVFLYDLIKAHHQFDQSFLPDLGGNYDVKDLYGWMLGSA
jgi:ornithine cyclodeaminase/alanine dehydrogenase-like protein (mu-crystallin family)